MHNGHAWDQLRKTKVPLNLHVPVNIRMDSNLKEPRDSKGQQSWASIYHSQAVR